MTKSADKVSRGWRHTINRDILTVLRDAGHEMSASSISTALFQKYGAYVGAAEIGSRLRRMAVDGKVTSQHDGNTGNTHVYGYLGGLE